MTETTTLEEFQAKFRTEELLVYRNDAWTWSVRPAQPTLGAGILSLNRFALTLGEVTPDEMSLLSDVTRKIEAAVSQTFNHQIMNYLALMMVDHHVHYHVLPRYDGQRDFAGLEWVDNGWPAFPVLSDAQHQDSDTALSDIQKALGAAV